MGPSKITLRLEKGRVSTNLLHCFLSKHSCVRGLEIGEVIYSWSRNWLSEFAVTRFLDGPIAAEQCDSQKFCEAIFIETISCVVSFVINVIPIARISQNKLLISDSVASSKIFNCVPFLALLQTKALKTLFISSTAGFTAQLLFRIPSINLIKWLIREVGRSYTKTWSK